MHDVALGPWAKSFPSSSWGMTAREFVSTEPRLSSFATPLLTIDREAAAGNVAVMADWLVERGLEIAPHGKTTMAPQLWQQLLDGGAWGITLATGWQVQLARSFGVRRIILANELIDPVALRWLGVELADPSFEFACWVDSVDSVELMRAGLAGAARPVDVVVELGSGRTGAGTVEDALAVAAAVDAAPELRLVGVGGYEGSAGSTRSAADLDAVRAHLDRIVAVHDVLDWQLKPIVTAGGSAYFDLVAERLGPLVGRATVVLRSGAYQLHDEGFYRGITPLPGLRSAMHGWARVLSRPEPGLAIVDGGKRDFPYDLDLPTTVHGPLSKLNDQHGYLPVVEDGPAVGDILRLGLSHPCTAFDKWRLIPVVENADADDPRVVDLVRTFF
ncbi:MAG: amino acid deaminase [Micrococcales bacterium 70-64]|nr:alanine racemase [Leifsonia sp.]ODU64486.1 MAG: amino acid deaminase [Leifsonia sp. SCN 70-46]OJX86178.1 MAG: amino acid deaminase [Micrococcales bacterium 70-64]